jgi:pSer/pThr/pTyr-binding forkhead associated (FHA) protein
LSSPGGPDAGCRLVLAHPSVAPKHAQVRREGAAHGLHDLRSPGGTWVGDAQVTPGAPRVLRDGDLVRLGQVVLRFRDPRPGGP